MTSARTARPAGRCRARADRNQRGRHREPRSMCPRPPGRAARRTATVAHDQPAALHKNEDRIGPLGAHQAIHHRGRHGAERCHRRHRFRILALVGEFDGGRLIELRRLGATPRSCAAPSRSPVGRCCARRLQDLSPAGVGSPPASRAWPMRAGAAAPEALAASRRSRNSRAGMSVRSADLLGQDAVVFARSTSVKKPRSDRRAPGLSASR